MQKVKSRFTGLYIKSVINSPQPPSWLVIVVILLGALTLLLVRYNGIVLRILITYESVRVVGSVAVVYRGLSGLMQVFVCIAVLTAVVGLTTWVCNQ